MAKSCVTEKTAQRQEWIENGLLELMLVKKFEEITVSELCRSLGLSRRSFYRYFLDLEDVLDSLLKHTFQNMVLPTPLPEIGDIQENFEFWRAHRSLLDALHNSGMIDKLFFYTLQATEEYLPHEDASLELRREASLFAVSGSVALIIDWYVDGFQKTPEQMAQISHRMLFKPILKSE